MNGQEAPSSAGPLDAGAGRADVRPAPRPDLRYFDAQNAAELEHFVAGRRLLAKVGPERIRYLTAFLREGATGFVRNAGRIKTAVVVVGEAVIPLVINDGAPADCYLVSPYVHYIAYMREEVKKMKPPIASWAIRAMLGQLGVLFRALQFDRFVSINNWLFTTSLTSHPTTEEILSLFEHLRRQFPSHALVYRGVDLRDEDLARALQRAGCEILVHRPVLEWEPARLPELSARAQRLVRTAKRLTERGPFAARTSTTLDRATAERVAWMYESLYIRKHSQYNAHFTARFFETVVQSGVSTIDLFERDGKLDAFATAVDDGARIVFALVGYDPAIFDKRLSPYTAAVGRLFARSLREERLLFLSTGVSEYKRNRGATEVMEYEAFDVRHLSAPRQLPWHTIRRFLDASLRFMNTNDI
jgi:hypothetical protein